MTEKTAETVADLPIAQIKTNGNIRDTMDKDRLKELADNIKQVGILNPLLIRAKDSVLIAGYRRLAAAKLAGLTKVPVRKMDVTENEAREIQTFENLHRADLSPLEEAKAFKQLSGSYTPAQLAEKVNKSAKYVYRSMKLLELPPKALKMLEGGEKMTPAHAYQVLRVPMDQQDKVIDYIASNFDSTPVAIGQLQRFIDGQIAKDLTKAIFPIDEGFGDANDSKHLAITDALMSNCAKCKFNTGNQGMLFDGATKGECTNGVCFNAKAQLFYKKVREKSAEKMGLDFHGMAGVEYQNKNPDVIKGAPVVDPSSAKIKAAMKKNPDAFKFAIVKSSSWQTIKPRTVIVCVDPKIIGMKTAPKRSNGQSDGDYKVQQEKWEKERIAGELATSIFHAQLVMNIHHATPTDVLAAIWGDDENEGGIVAEMCQAIGIECEKKFPRKEIDAMELPKRIELLIAALVAMAFRQYGEVCSLFKMDWSAIKKTSLEQMEKVWAEKQAAKKEAAAATKKEAVPA